MNKQTEFSVLQRRVLAQMVLDERLTLQQAAKGVAPYWLVQWMREPYFLQLLAATEELQRRALRHKCLVARMNALARPPAAAPQSSAAEPAGTAEATGAARATGAAADAPPFGPPPLVDDGQRTLTQEEFEELIRQCTPAEEDEQ